MAGRLQGMKRRLKRKRKPIIGRGKGRKKVETERRGETLKTEKRGLVFPSLFPSQPSWKKGN